jgi:predicted permease
LLLTYWLADTLPALVPNVGVAVDVGFRPNPRLLGFLAVVCALAALVAGAVPALFTARMELSEVMKEGGRSGSSSKQSHGLRAVLVISEVALAAVSVSGAGLFLRSFQNALAIHPGFDSGNVILMRFFLPAAEDPDGRVQDYSLRLRERLSEMPGVEEAAYSNDAPLGSSAGPYFDIAPEGYVPPPGTQLAENYSMVSPGYFRLLRIPLLEGRDFTENDDQRAPRVLIVDEAFARRYFQGANPVGRRVRYRGQWGTVVGLVKNHRYHDPVGPLRPHLYVSFRQLWGGGTQQYFYLRVKGDSAAVMAGLRKVVASVDGQPRAFHPMPLSEWTQVTLLPQKLAASFLAGLGALSLLLAALGLYSVMAYAVSERTREIGIRVALGARPGDVLAGVVGRGMLLTAAGLAAGIAGGLALARLAAGMLVNISSADAATFTAAAGFLALVALVACCVPALRATRVDPVTALRTE